MLTDQQEQTNANSGTDAAMHGMMASKPIASHQPITMASLMPYIIALVVHVSGLLNLIVFGL